jgi:pimeloyl-ACP methyl ester carboxylesterase
MSAKPSIVFAHGIWADGSCYNKLVPALRAEGHEVISAQYGLNSNDEDVAATVRYFGRVSGPIILVGHSYGGAVITAAGTDDRVAGLVYIAALGPDETETSESEQAKFPVTPAFGQIEVADGRVWLKPTGIGCFCGDLPEEEQKVVWATAGGDPVRPQRAGRGLENQAVLVHRGQQRPGGEPGTRAGRGQADGCHHLRHRQQPRPHAVAPRLRPRRYPRRRSRRLSQHALSGCRPAGGQPLREQGR